VLLHLVRCRCSGMEGSRAKVHGDVEKRNQRTDGMQAGKLRDNSTS
jgi:hypothetical protein